MTLLNPTPISLGLASPAIGPWFQTSGTGPLPTLGGPGISLSVPVNLPAGMQWCAPAGCTSSYYITTSPLPAGLAKLRQANGSSAFQQPGALIVLVTLLPEVELRLAALTALIPTPNNRPVTAGTTGRPPVRHLALEVPATAASSMGAIALLRENGFPSDLSTDAEKAEYIGLSVVGGVVGNAKKPVSELHRPSIPVLGSADEVIVENRTGSQLSVTLWAFDDRGRALDPGAVANWWAFMASGTILPTDPLPADLWADPIGTGRQQTASVNAGRYVLFCSPHEGAPSNTYMARLNLTGLTAVSSSTTLFRAGTNPAITLTAAQSPDDMPMPRLALLPTGPYGAPGGVALFNGWTGAAWPANLTRDFVRIAVTDIESDLVGLTRTNAAQNDPDLRVIAAANTAGAPVLTTADAATAVVMTTVNAGAASVAMAPVMETDWGAIVPAPLGATALPNSLQFTVHALRGEGTAGGDTVSGQSIAVRFPPGALPAGAWVRVWPHGLDTETGQRFRLDGGGGTADSTGQAFVVTRLPDGAAVSRLSFDALVVVAGASTYYLEQRFDRPPLDSSGGRVPLPAVPGLPSGFAPWMCEQGALLPRTTLGGLLGGGVTLLGLPTDLVNGTYALIVSTTIDPTDVVPNTLRRAAGAGDQFIVTEPAYLDTLEGDLVAGPGPNGANAMVRRARNKFLDDVFDASAPVGDLTVMGRPAPTMERREVFAVDPANAAQTGVVAGVSARATHHEAIPAQLGHPGMPATTEIHGGGIALAGPVMVPLVQLMRERAATNLVQFIVAASANIAPAAPPAGATTFASVLETLTFGVTGDGLLRSLLLAGTFQPGQTWDQWKAWIEARVGDIDQYLNPNIADDTLAAALDRVVLKTRDGAAQAATALTAAIGRAEDFIYLETPAIDALTAGGGTSDPVGAIDLVGTIKSRLSQRPDLIVILCVPERFLPGQPSKLEEIRVAGINAALKSLTDAAPANVELFTPIAGSGRRVYMASTTVIVDDVFMLTGTTHLWRRGLTFDSSIAVSLFDDALTMGRPAAVRGARLQLVADRLGLPVGFSPTDPAHVLDAVKRLNASGGMLRVQPGSYVPRVDPSGDDRDAWNPDGRPGGISDWFLFFNELAQGLREPVNSAIR